MNLKYIGGNVWESNPPKKLLTPHAGFEDQREHQNPSTPNNYKNNFNIERGKNQLLNFIELQLSVTKMFDFIKKMI